MELRLRTLNAKKQQLPCLLVRAQGRCFVVDCALGAVPGKPSLGPDQKGCTGRRKRKRRRLIEDDGEVELPWENSSDEEGSLPLEEHDDNGIDGKEQGSKDAFQPLSSGNASGMRQTRAATSSGGVNAGHDEYTFERFDVADVPWENVDFVLLSNEENATGLPYITQYTRKFEGVVYATEPTREFARLRMEELVHYFGRHDVCASVRRYAEDDMYPIYTADDVRAAIERIVCVSFGEHLRTAEGGFVITPYSSGYCLGGTNWHIRSDQVNLAIMSKSSLRGPPFTATFDARVLDVVDGVVFTDMRTRDAQEYRTSANQLGAIVASTLSNRGNIIIPINATGFAYDIIEGLTNHLGGMGFRNTPFYFFSPVAQRSMHYAHVMGEWMSPHYQERMYDTEIPVSERSIVESGLVHYADEPEPDFADKVNEPCVVFCGHPSLYEGAVKKLLKLWSKNKKHAIVLIESPPQARHELRRYHPLAMNIFECIFDPKMTVCETLDLVRPYKIENIFVPAYYEPEVRRAMSESGAGLNLRFLDSSATEIITLPPKPVKAWITEDLAGNIDLIRLPNVSIARARGTLEVRDDKYQAKPGPVNEIVVLMSKRCLWGSFDRGDLERRLLQNQITQESAQWFQGNLYMTMTRDGAKATIRTRNSGTVTQVQSRSTGFCMLLRDILLQLFTNV